jgi:hypothetical protein
MVHIVVAALGAALVLTTWLSVTRTVFTPRQRSSLLTRWTVRVTAAAVLAPARMVHEDFRERVADLCAPVSLLSTAVLWAFLNTAGFALVDWGTSDTPLGAGQLADLFLFRSGRPVLATAVLLSNGILLATFTTHLSRVLAAYTRREGPVTKLAARVTQTPEADLILADYLRAGSRDHLDDMFADWGSWLADLQTTHLSYPAIAYLRPFGGLCWAKAALIVLDCAAITEATAPSWAPPNTRPLLAIGGYCLPRLARQLGEDESRFPVSYHGRETSSFCDTYRLAVGAGLPPERTEAEAEDAFMRLRIDYAPYVTAIAERLLYHNAARERFRNIRSD